jgi:hypothetical protein
MLIGLGSALQERLRGGSTYQKDLPITPATAVREEVFGGSKPTLAFPRSKGEGGGGVPNASSGWQSF